MLRNYLYLCAFTKKQLYENYYPFFYFGCYHYDFRM